MNPINTPQQSSQEETHTPTAGNVVRTHDDLYINVDPNAAPKDSFVFTANLIRAYKSTLNKSISIADIGCAHGAFPHYLKSIFPGDHIEGYEYLPALVQASRSYYPDLVVKQASILDRTSIPAKKFEVITLLGVLSIFDDIEPPIADVVCWTKPGGKILIHGMFNPFDIDVFVKYRSAKEYGQAVFESGWNIVSQKTASNILKKYGAKAIRFHKFNISVDLEQNRDDPVRSWTEKLSDGSRQIVNGLCLKQPQFILEADI